MDPQIVASVIIALGTAALALATVWLCAEVRRSRIADAEYRKAEAEYRKGEAEYREREDVVRGIRPFVGKYAEPGQLDFDKSGLPKKDVRGARLEVNWYGAVLVSPSIGSYAGGYLEIQDGGLVFELGAVTSKDGKTASFRVAVLQRVETESYFEGESVRQSGSRSRGLPDSVHWTDWKLELRGWADRKWNQLSTIKLVKYSDYSPRSSWRGSSAPGQPFDQF